MTPINGNDLVLAIDDVNGSEQAFAFAQTCSLSFSNPLIDATHKDSDSWEEVTSGRRNFSLTGDGLVDFESVSDRQNTPAFGTLASAGTGVFFTFTNEDRGFSGRGFFESFEISSASDEVATYTTSIKGTTNLRVQESFEGDGFTAAFTLSFAPLESPEPEIRVDGTLATAATSPSDATEYSISGAIVTFGANVASNADITIEYAV